MTTIANAQSVAYAIFLRDRGLESTHALREAFLAGCGFGQAHHIRHEKPPYMDAFDGMEQAQLVERSHD
jgi:hypothetical protein